MPQMSENRKKILFIITQLEMGGAQRFLVNLLARISNNYDIKVAFGSDGISQISDKLNTIGVNNTALKHLRRNINPLEDLKAVFEIKKLIQDFKPDDLFLLSSKAGFIGSLAGKLSAHRLRLRVIYRIGGWSFNDPRSLWQKKLWLRLEKQSARNKDVIIVNSTRDMMQAEKLGIKPREKLITIYNGIDPYSLNLLPKEEARKELLKHIPSNAETIRATKIIGTVANFYPTKGLKYFIESAEHFKNNDDVIFVLVGDGEQKNELQDMIREKGLENKIFLTGQIADSHRLMPAFDIFVLPSVKEGFPWVVIEAMSAKIPVIATKVGAVPEIIDNGKNGFIVEPRNSASIAGKIKELLVNDHLIKEFSIEGHQTVLFKFSEEKMVKEIEAIL